MSILLTVAAQVVLGLVILAAAAFAVWVVWDCTAGPSARLATEHRARREVHDR